MSLPLFARIALLCGCLAVAAPPAVRGQTNIYFTNGLEYAIAGSSLGDQVRPHAALSLSGGYLVWEDSFTDGDGLGISALQLDNGFSGMFSSFRVNSTGAGDQERAQVSMLNGGGAVFVWQGGPQGFQRIYARFLSAGKTWQGNDVLVNTFTNNTQSDPAVAALTGGNVLVAWSSHNQISSGSLRDVYAQLLSPAGQKIGGEFLVNQFTSFNQRSPAVAALSGGGFVVVWVSEQERVADTAGAPSVDVYGRLYTAAGDAVGGEFLINTGNNICAFPDVAAASDGGFLVTWGEKDPLIRTNNWDIFTRPFSGAGQGGATRRVNTYAFGDQYSPSIAATGADYLLIWTSLGQDGSHEGVYGQFLRGDGSPWGPELRVNTTVINGQIHPCVASDGNGRFLTAWTSYEGGANSFDLRAQRYAQYLPPLPALDAPLIYVPFVATNRVYQPQIQVLWPLQAGLPVDHYEVYVDGAGTPAALLATNVWLMTAANGLTANSTHSFRVLYATTDGRRSPLSPPASGTTWGGISRSGIPVEWWDEHWWDDWPPADQPLAPGGLTPRQVFLSGGDPLEPSTWLRTDIIPSAQGFFLRWNPQPGHTYQVQSSADLRTWANLASPRFAAGTEDSLYLGGSNRAYYRVLCLH